MAYGREDIEDNEDNLFIATAMGKLGAVNLSAAYYNAQDGFETVHRRHHHRPYSTFDDLQIFSITVAGDVAEDLTLSGEYIKSNQDNVNGDDGFVFGLNYKGAEKKVVGSYGLYAMYNDQPNSTYIEHTTDATTFDDGFKGYTLGLDYTVAENVIATINYFDTEAQELNDDDKVIMSQLYVFF